jgi:uncharacterized protein (DUF1501 family)
MDRRAFLARSGLGLLGTFAPRIAFAKAATAKRFVFIIQRGAADGLGTIGAVGDPAFVGARGDLAADVANGTKLDAMFALHPAMTTAAALYGKGQALFAHAVASPYRDRSHFDGQNVLETGGTGAYQLKDGWMNRLLGIVPTDDAKAIAVAATVPMALRGAREVASYAPSSLPDASGDLMARVTQLYRGDDQLHRLWGEAMKTRELTDDLAKDNGATPPPPAHSPRGCSPPPMGPGLRRSKPAAGTRTPVSAAGWRQQLKGLDAMLAALQTGLGPVWDDTLVLVATEFGRTVAVNGTGGTDHGTGTATMLFGGAVKGGRVLADWPGLATANLYEARDLKPTTSSMR